jgi:hypothetical protein
MHFDKTITNELHPLIPGKWPFFPANPILIIYSPIWIYPFVGSLLMSEFAHTPCTIQIPVPLIIHFLKWPGWMGMGIMKEIKYEGRRVQLPLLLLPPAVAWAASPNSHMSLCRKFHQLKKLLIPKFKCQKMGAK